eukprot:1640665-Prymnesium_polylepis.1
MARRPGCERWIFPPVMLPAQEVTYRARDADGDGESSGLDSEAEGRDVRMPGRQTDLGTGGERRR